MKTVENLYFSEANFKTALGQVLHPHGHGILRSLWNLVTRGHKYSWKGLETLEINQNELINQEYYRADEVAGIVCETMKDRRRSKLREPAWAHAPAENFLI